jgi:F1F0 ATPase subunit 2
MQELLSLYIPFLAGMAFGVCYFAGLWLTVGKLPDSAHPFLNHFLSFVVRTTLLLAGFYVVMDGCWDKLAAVLFGFLIVKGLFVYRLQIHAL